jgi:hypothetical protein
MQAVQQCSKFDECGSRSQRRSNAYIGIRRWVSDPRWEPGNGAVGQLAEDILPACELRPPFDAKPLAIQGVKPIMNIDVLWTMGIMFLARPERARAIWRKLSLKL